MNTTQDEIKSKVRGFIIETFLIGEEKNSFEDNDSFMATGIIDSLGILEVTSFLETEFGVTVKDDEMTPSNLDSVINLVTFVSRKLT